MKLRYILIISSIIFLSFFFISINAQTITTNQVLNLGGKTFSPLNKISTNYQQSVFLTQEGKHKLIVSAKDLSSLTTKIIVTPNTTIDTVPVITGKADPLVIDNPEDPNYNLPPSSYLPDKMYGDIGYTPGFDVVEYIKNIKQPKNTDGSTVVNLNGSAPLTGSYHIPVLLVEFADFPNTISSSVFDDQFNSNYYLNGGGTSVSRYYYHESYGDLDITYDIYDWRTLTAHSYTWYGTGNNAFQFLLDTMNLFGTGPNAIDFTQYDSDNDGRIDGVIMLHAGYSLNDAGPGNIGNQARIFNLSTSYIIQGMYYGNVAIISEKIPSNICNSNFIQNNNYPTDCRGRVLTATHEFAHVLGLPDLYQINPANGAQVGNGLGDITMMVQSGASHPQKPINFDLWSRYFFGWIEPTVIDGSMSGNYTLPSIDIFPNGAYILRDNSKMNTREYFLVANRYRSNYNQDKWLFGGFIGQIYNLNGGLEIYHVDEQYIEDQYPTNSVMFDADMNMYDDTLSHPGIVFEQNALADFSNNQNLHSMDLYTTEWSDYFPNIPDFGTFDNIERLDPPNLLWDTTSRAYTGLQDTGVKVQALSGSGYNVLAYLQSEAGPFNIYITYPKNNKWYKYTNPIDFTVNMNNNTGTVSCVWTKSNADIISTECEFSATPESMSLGYLGCSGIHELTVTATDSGTATQATDDVHIKVWKNLGDVCEPMPSSQMDKR